MIHPPSSLEDGVYEPFDYLRQVTEDLEYLADEIDELSGQVDEVAKFTKEQMELSQGFRNSMLALLVAVYVPVSFASVSS